MLPQENEYKSLLPKNTHGSPNFDKAAYIITCLKNEMDRYSELSFSVSIFVYHLKRLAVIMLH